jgi:dimethylaniline monooxygenase (N-oxide forming)
MGCPGQAALAGGANARVCVIGAGAGGVATAKALLDRGVEFDWFERAPRVGGLWAEDESGHPVAYRSLHMNSSKRKMQFSDFPMPDTYPDFPSREQVAAYLTAYARHFGVNDRVALGREVTDVKSRSRGDWEVSIDDHERRTYDVVLVASGYHSSPKLPVDAARGFGGEVLHSHDVNDASRFAGRHVLVVGFGNSAVDIASLVSTTAAQTYLSTRRGAHVVPKYLFGRPFDELPAPPWPRALRWGWYGLAIRIAVGSLGRYGLPTPTHYFGHSAVTISSDLLARISHGDVQPRPAVADFHDAGVTFADGQRNDVDTVIYCTGYSHSAPFLERNGLDPGGIGYRLFEQIWDPRFSGLAHIGLVQPLGSVFPVVEVQTQVLADWAAGDYALPNCAAMLRAIGRAHRRRDRRYVPSERHLLQVDEPDYSQRLAREHRRGARRARRERRQAGAARPHPVSWAPSTALAPSLHVVRRRADRSPGFEPQPGAFRRSVR